MDRPTLRDQLERGHERLELALATLTDEAMLDRIDDEWTRKDVVAHLEAWERRVVGLLALLRAGEPIGDAEETDRVNARFFARDRDRTLPDVLAGELDAHATLLATIDGATDEELFDGRHFAWTEGEPFASWFRANGDEHSDEHLEQLTRPALPARTGGGSG